MTSQYEQKRERIDAMVRDRNYVAAYEAIKSSSLEEMDRTEVTGRLVSTIVDELSQCTRREDKEKAVYFRTLLAWIFRDVPGLSTLYREQLRLANRSEGDLAAGLYRNFRTFSDVAGGRKSVGEGVEETAESIRASFEEAAENFRSGNPSESMRSFMTAAETGIREGLTQMGRLFEGLNEQAAGTRAEPEKNDGDPTERPTEPFDSDIREDAEDVEFEKRDD